LNITKTALITGIAGQDGPYLAELLLEKGYHVHGLVRRSSSGNTQRIDHLCSGLESSGGQIHLHHGDLTEGLALRELVLDVKPDEIYNLAAQSHVQISFDKPVYTASVNAIGALNVLEAARQLDKLKPTRICQACSSEMFGDAIETPQNEQTPFRPRSPYGCSKVFAFHQTVNYRDAHALFAVNAILFNHESPRRGETFVTRKITRAAARIKLGLQDKLSLGNLDAKRDWGFAGDYVEGMWQMLQHDQPEDFVLATGVEHTIRQFLDFAFGYLDLDWTEHVETDPKYLRPSDVNLLRGDASKAKQILGWEASTNCRELAELMVDHDLELAREEATHQSLVRG
jgi:GDPmannose 4,6-dehydratase